MEKCINRQDLEERILKYMADHNTISLATVTDRQPHAATVFYVSIGFELFFVSNPTSRHSINLERNPIVSGTINEDYSNWLKIKGIQLEGKVDCIGGIFENKRIVTAYIKKFPNVADFFVSPKKLGEAIARKVSKVRFYRIIPERIFFIDNATGFGDREELLISPIE